MKSWLIVVLIVMFGFSLQASADSDNWQTLEGVVQNSKIVLSVTVKEVAHVKEKKKAYGKTYTYIEEYQLKVTVDEVLEGDASFKGQTIWVSQGGEDPPGKDTFIAFFTSTGKGKTNRPGSRWSYNLRQHEESGKKEEIIELLKKKAAAASQPTKE